MEPAWVKLDTSDALYAADKERYAVDAYPFRDRRPLPDGELPDIGPDSHTASDGYWTIWHDADTDRFIAEKTVEGEETATRVLGVHREP